MKKKVILYVVWILVIFLGVCSVLFDFNKKENGRHITLAEVTHSIFYAPMYVAIEEGYFKEMGIDVDLILTSGADKVSAALISGDADIGLCGSEATIYVYNSGEKDYLKTFSQLTQKDGSFIVAREDIKDFNLDKLRGKTIIGGRRGGMPEMTLEYILKGNNIIPGVDVNVDTSVAFSAMSGAFIGGQGDFVTLFEPTATEVERQGYGHVVASVGDLGGVVPYTSFSARSSYINKNKEIIRDFDKAIRKGIDYVFSHSDKEIAKSIKRQFPNTSMSLLEEAIKRYKSIDAWPKDTLYSESSFNHLQDIMIQYGELKNKVSYNKLIYKIKY